MDSFVNWSLLREPYNWIVVILMLAIGVTALTLLSPALQSVSPSS